MVADLGQWPTIRRGRRPVTNRLRWAAARQSGARYLKGKAVRTYSLMPRACVGVAGLQACGCGTRRGARRPRHRPCSVARAIDGLCLRDGVAPDGTNWSPTRATTRWRSSPPAGSCSLAGPGRCCRGDEAENARDIAVDDNGFIMSPTPRVPDHQTRSGGRAYDQVVQRPIGDRLGSPIGITAKKNKIYVSDGAKKSARLRRQWHAPMQVFTATGHAICRPCATPIPTRWQCLCRELQEQQHRQVRPPTGACLTTWGSQGTASGQFKNPYGVRVARDPKWGEVVYVADSTTIVSGLSKTGALKAVVGKAGAFNQTGTFTTLAPGGRRPGR